MEQISSQDLSRISYTEPIKILIVDDEPGTLNLVRKILHADGHDIYEAMDGEQAIELFTEIRPDVVLLDVVIPKMDGLDVLKNIRRIDKVAGVIMVSALSSEKLAHE
ncbi:response regulator [Chloroflexi bacterium TSY]|nr:response regulator [Chloroflexi bacterium TSY]MBV7331985.1 response regulator [Chloroflexi bacterium TSY]